MSRARLLRLVACGLPLLACMPGDEDTGSTTNSATVPTATAPNGEVIYYTRDLEVNCEGMSVWTYEGSAYGETRAPTFGDLTLSEQDLAAAFGPSHPIQTVPRCGYWFEPPFEPGPVDLLNLENFTFGTQGTGMLKIAWGGQMWTPHHGDVVLTGDPSHGRGRGWHDAVFKGTSGELARIRGEFEWCEPAIRSDCAGAVVGELPYPFEVEFPAHAPGWNAPTFGWGQASACRVLIDTATSGMRVDLQAAFWRDASITRLYAGACGNVPVDVMNFNHLVFETGGVTGPGTYGPVAVHDYGDVNNPNPLPRLDFETPFSFLYAGTGYSPAGFCALAQGGFQRGHALTTPESVCTYTIAEGEGGEPGDLWLNCTEVDHSFPGGENNNNAVGDLDLWARCDVEVR